jgi:two-component system, chemotaxis family, protein-glutamate methylesterase/glutaminase
VSGSVPNGDPTGFDVVALVASLGGLAAISAVLSALPEDFPARVVVVQHGRTVPDSPHRLAHLLGRQCVLPVRTAETGTPLATPGVTVVPPGALAEVGADGRYVVGPAPREAAGHLGDVLLRSLADAIGPRAIAVVLTGMLSDGTEGVRAVHRNGGRVVVQEPESAHAASMPTGAIGTGCVDHILPLERIGPALVTLTVDPDGPGPSSRPAGEVRVPPGPPSPER